MLLDITTVSVDGQVSFQAGSEGKSYIFVKDGMCI